ncbi:MAG TPA: hypothetical protein VFR47_16760 [Anaerolineales bacterium]|nr:hypothetical protein [Anaerolineales bacterium]
MDGTPKTVTADGSGDYSFNVPVGWSGVVTPSHPCYTFSPASNPYTNVTTDQTNQNYNTIFNTASRCANVDVTIGGNLVGSYGVASGAERREYYAVSGGPVVVESINDLNLVSAISPIGNNLNIWKLLISALE